MMKKTYTLFLIVICSWVLDISEGFSQTISKDTIAPSIINATGGSSVYNDITYEWSIGEALITDAMSSGGIIVINGILQPAAPESATRYDNNNQWSKDEIRIFPNPARDWLTIKFLSVETGRVTVRLWDAAGKCLYFKQFYFPGGSRAEMINVSRYASGDYILNIDLAISLSGPSIQKHGNYIIQVIR